ncbi:MAG: FixH family protein [Phycisphaerales bacterium]
MSEAPIQKKGIFRSGKQWPLIIVGMLMFHASLIFGTIMVVSARHDLYVEPDYYAKSIEWDSQREMMEAAEKHGWDVELLVGEPEATSTGARPISVVLHDANGESIDRALVEVDCFHPAHATDRKYAVAPGVGEGRYETHLDILTPGYWQAKISIRYQGVEAMLTKEFEVK